MTDGTRGAIPVFFEFLALDRVGTSLAGASTSLDCVALAVFAFSLLWLLLHVSSLLLRPWLSGRIKENPGMYVQSTQGHITNVTNHEIEGRYQSP